MTADGGIAPTAAEGTRHTISIEADGNAPRRAAARELAEDAANNLRLGRHDAALTGRRLGPAINRPDDLIAVAEPAARLAGGDTPHQPAPRLVGEVLEEQRVHGALEADVQVRDLAFRQRHDRHAGKRHALEDAGHILLVAADAVERFRQHDLEAAGERIGEQRLDAGPDQRCSRDRAVGIALENHPALPFGVDATEPQLVLDGCLALVVGREAGVERDTGHGPLREPLLRVVEGNQRTRRKTRRDDGTRSLRLLHCFAQSIVVRCRHRGDGLARDLPPDGARDHDHPGIGRGGGRAAVVVGGFAAVWAGWRLAVPARWLINSLCAHG